MKLTVILDMDGTIADLYKVENWLGKLRNFDPTPYAEAALMVLGYTKQEAAYALKGLDASKDAETLIREGLKKLMK
jgi:Holliday junction resolvasome RuvABC DNA-binding subunit